MASLKTLLSKHKLYNARAIEEGVEEEEVQEEAPQRENDDVRPASSDRKELERQKSSLSSSKGSKGSKGSLIMREKQWHQMSLLIEKARDVYLDDRKYSLLQKCITRRDPIVLELMVESNGNFTKFLQYFELAFDLLTFLDKQAGQTSKEFNASSKGVRAEGKRAPKNTVAGIKAMEGVEE